jgi:hypothetical protein
MIAFDSRAGGQANINVVNPLGGVPRKLDVDIRGNSTPSWSHDGAWIYFENGEDDAHHTTGWKVPSTGGHAVSISKGEVLQPIDSPDGLHVYFQRQGWLWSVRTDGTGEQKVDGMPEIYGYPWTPFKSGIYFIGPHGGKVAIQFIDLGTKRVRVLHELDKGCPDYIGGIPVSSDGKWLLFPQQDEVSSDLMMVENWN